MRKLSGQINSSLPNRFENSVFFNRPDEVHLLRAWTRPSHSLMPTVESTAPPRLLGFFQFLRQMPLPVSGICCSAGVALSIISAKPS